MTEMDRKVAIRLIGISDQVLEGLKNGDTLAKERAFRMVQTMARKPFWLPFILQCLVHHCEADLRK